MNQSLTLSVLSLLGLGCLAGQPLPSAEEILTKVADTYRPSQKYLLAGTGTIQSPDLREPKSTPFTFAVELPDKMRMEGDASAFGMGLFAGTVLFVSDGEYTWVYDAAASKYYKTRRSSPRGAVGTFDNREPDLDRPEQFVAYFNFFFTVAQGEKLLDKTRVNTLARSEALSIGGRQVECYVVQSDTGAYEERKAGSSRDTIWVDRRRSIVWREEQAAWLGNGLQERSRTDLTSVIIDEPLPADTFVFKPPKGSQEAPIPARH
jgi:outer membrane lipoprotein-sorting protein